MYKKNPNRIEKQKLPYDLINLPMYVYLVAFFIFHLLTLMNKIAFNCYISFLQYYTNKYK